MSDEVENDEYKKAVQALLRVVNRGTGSSLGAALVLLSAFNCYEYHIDLNAICAFDVAHMKHVSRVINGRVLLSKEPHTLIENGTEIFEDLSERFKKYRVS